MCTPWLALAVGLLTQLAFANQRVTLRMYRVLYVVFPIPRPLSFTRSGFRNPVYVMTAVYEVLLKPVYVLCPQSPIPCPLCLLNVISFEATAIVGKMSALDAPV